MTQPNTAQIIEIQTQTPRLPLEKHLGDFWGTFGGAENSQSATELSESDTPKAGGDMRKKILHKLEQADLRNKKGRENALKLISSDNGIRLIHDTAQANNGNRDQYVDGLLALIEQYDCGAACSARAICGAASREGLTANMLEKHLWPVMIKLGVVLKLSEKSSRWEVAENIGKHENALLRKARILFDVSDERLELRRQQIKAQDEARLLIIAKKQATLAQKRKQLAMTAANASGEAARITETLPDDQSTGAFMKQNMIPMVVMGLFAIVMVGGLLSGEDTSDNSAQSQNVEWAGMSNTATAQVNYGQQPDNQWQQPLPAETTTQDSVWAAPTEEAQQ